MKKQTCIVFLSAFLISSCSWLPTWSSLNPFSSDEKQTEEKAPETGVNPYLWQASLEKLSFMPLASTDAAGGVIVSDWAEMNGARGEQFKVTVNILSKNLRADCLKVTVFKRVYENGRWTDAAADRRLSDEIEKAILTEAKILYRRAVAARGE